MAAMPEAGHVPRRVAQFLHLSIAQQLLAARALQCAQLTHKACRRVGVHLAINGGSAINELLRDVAQLITARVRLHAVLFVHLARVPRRDVSCCMGPILPCRHANFIACAVGRELAAKCVLQRAPRLVVQLDHAHKVEPRKRA
eukprot:scaffold77343_cov69-Phaeocystis_antarctica.AAC.2